MASATEVLGDLPDYGENRVNQHNGPSPNVARPSSPAPASPEAESERLRASLTKDHSLTEDHSHPEKPPDNPVEDESWTSLVARLQAGDSDAMAELYQVFAKGIRFYLCRQVGPQELDDRVHDAFLVVVQSIQKGELRDPRRLMGFVRTVVRRMVAAQIDREVQIRRETTELDNGDRIADQRANPEKSFIMRQKISLIREILHDMTGKDREILYRFYVEEQHPDRICEEMNLSITQFRLLKSRAKARFGELGRKKLQPGSTNCDDPVRTFG
jgi:RNA polymerase sigma-70 factor (ECF subfamily)